MRQGKVLVFCGVGVAEDFYLANTQRASTNILTQSTTIISPPSRLLLHRNIVRVWHLQALRLNIILQAPRHQLLKGRSSDMQQAWHPCHLLCVMNDPDETRILQLMDAGMKNPKFQSIQAFRHRPQLMIEPHMVMLHAECNFGAVSRSLLSSSQSTDRTKQPWKHVQPRIANMCKHVCQGAREPSQVL